MSKQVKKVKAIIKNNGSNTREANETKKYHFKNLIFEGGGVKGIAYVGALEVLEKEGILKDVERVAGTSAGAMVAVFVALGYTAEEISDILWSINFKNFMDSSWGIVRDLNRLINDYGWYKGDYFRNLMAGYIEKKTKNGEITFKELAKSKKFRELHLIGADLSTGYSKVFNATNTPNVKVADAARISMSIPLFFAAVKGVEGDDHIYVDGGLLNNYAIKSFDRQVFVADEANARRTDYYEKINKRIKEMGGTLKMPKINVVNEYVYNKETLGFRLDGKEDIELYLNPNAEPPVKEIKTLFTYTKALVTALIDFQNNIHLHSDDWQRTIYINTSGVDATDFNISDSKKEQLVAAGRGFTEDYLEWYNNDEEKANK